MIRKATSLFTNLTLKNLLSPSLSAQLIVWSLVSPCVFAEPESVPPDVLQLLPGGYVSADYPAVFDDIEGDGLTFETWIYMTARPKERPNGFVPDGQWLIFAKPGSYYATVSARTLTDGYDRTRPEGTGDCVMPKTGTSSKTPVSGRCKYDSALAF